MRRVVRIAFAQDGLITRRQALAAGMSNGAVGRAIRRTGPVMLDLEGDPLTNHAQRWTLRLVPHARAAIDAVRQDRLDMIAAHPAGLPATVEARLLRDTRALLCEVVQRRRATIDLLAAELASAPNGGMSTARRAMADVLAGCRSAPECELRDLISHSRVLPSPRWNKPLPDYRPVRGERRIIPDCCWPEARLIVEVNSTQWHQLGDGPERTEQRMARYAELGWLVIPLSPYRIRAEPSAVLHQLETTYLARTSR